MASDELKSKGNAAFSAGKFEEAVNYFTRAVDADPQNHVLYSNRSAALASLSRFEEALSDANKVVELKPDWPKGYSRVGAALHGLRRYDESLDAYEKGLELDPGNAQIKQGISDTLAAQGATTGGGGAGAGGLFTNPSVLSRLATDPRTRGLLGQPDFMQILHDVNTSPDHMQRYLADDRFQLAMEVGLGLNMAPKGASEEGAAASRSSREPKPSRGAAAQAESKAEPEPELDDDAKAEAAAKAAAQVEKEAGNEAYKKKDFEAAIGHYNRAIELYDRDVSFLTNRAAVKYEQGDFEGCIADCDAAVERGRELRADYKLIARALTRKGNALCKSGDLEGSIAVYNRSLTEHRNADTLKRLHEAERALKESKETAYVDMVLSGGEKDKGNAAFKEGKYPEAVAHYTEALKRGPPSVNPEAHKLYSNRAACYTKLGAWAEGLKDAEECIRLAPTFSKGYSRKGHLQFFMKEYDKAIATYEQGLAHDPDSSELKEGLLRCVAAVNKMNRGEGVSEEELRARRERGMADPEVQAILTDPVMRQVLSDMQEDPASAQKHMAHPEIAKKIEKLVGAGIIQIR